MSTRSDPSKNPRLVRVANLADHLTQASHPAIDVRTHLETCLAALMSQWASIAHATVYLFEPGSTHMIQTADAGSPQADLVPDDEFLAAQAGRERALIPPAPDQNGLRWAVPLESGDQPVGALVVQWRAGHPIPDAFEIALRTFVLPLGPAVDHLQTLTTQHQTLVNHTSAALSDVTELLTQRAFYEEALEQITARLQQQTDVKTMLQETMFDLGQVLGAHRARVRLQVVHDTDRSDEPMP